MVLKCSLNKCNLHIDIFFFTAFKNFGPASFSVMGPRGKRTDLNERFYFTSCHENNKETQYVNDFLDTNSVQSVFCFFLNLKIKKGPNLIQ